ncbi:MAG: hypothetical protein A2293_01275 [Elusimicrobia bacterium RIFOXYB2_FULL_49_7]|nr:MAG: hypothetical protein A2293_01275 [Elusimicrobia bacterium RIFOXYB2_FULL_49_7]
MNIALLHYHLRPGGVTTVIQLQHQTLTMHGHRVLVLTGEAPTLPFNGEVTLLSAAGYGANASFTPDMLARQIREACDRAFKGKCDLLLVHNPLLRKNDRLIPALKMLQTEDRTILIQVHDFAEDGRPEALSPETYPKNCHYAVINQRDERLLSAAGLKPGGLHLLPNAVLDVQLWPIKKTQSGEKYLLYPVRAIRRKNVGEAVLLSLFLEKGTQLKISQPPQGERDEECYQDWKAFARRLNCPVQFEAGLSVPFDELYAGCRAVVTTSMNEGFGMVFLEPWIKGKRVVGRFLREVGEDFLRKGMDFTGLYEKLLIPLTWLPLEELRRKWLDTWVDRCRDFGLECDPDRLKAHFESLCSDSGFDFGWLSETEQRIVIEKVVASPDAAQKLIRLNPCLAPGWDSTLFPELMERNRRSVAASYRPDGYAVHLEKICRTAVSEPIVQQINKQKLAEAFLAPERFTLMKWQPYVA